MKKILLRFILIIYICLIGLIALSSIKYDTILTLIMGLLCILFLYLISYLNKKYNIFNKTLKNKKLIFVLVLLALILRFTLLLFKYNNVSSDEATFFFDAMGLAEGQQFGKKYVAIFPYLYGYINILSIFFKMFGSNLYNAIILNIFLDLIGSFFAYLFGKRVFKTKEIGNLFLLIWLFNPFQILWCMRAMPIIIVNTTIMICVYIFTLLVGSFKSNKYLLFSILLGLSVGFSNSFRPIMIIFLIAIALYFIYLVLFDNFNIKKILISFALIICSYCGFNSINSIMISNALNYELPKNSSGWSIYVGSNVKSNGTWFYDEDFNTLASNDSISTTELHNYFMTKAINNYKSYSPYTILKLMFNKYTILTGLVYKESYGNLGSRISNPNYIYNLFFKIYTCFYWFLMILLNLSLIKKIKNCNIKIEYIPYILLTIGFLLSHLFVEVAPRYFTPILVPLMLIIGYIFNDIFNHNDRQLEVKND